MNKKIIIIIILGIAFFGILFFAKQEYNNKHFESETKPPSFVIFNNENQEEQEPTALENVSSSTEKEEKINEKIATPEEPKIFPNKGKIIIDNVPFVPQAPYGDWKDPRQQDGCEEISSLLAVYWAQDKKLNKTEAIDELFKIAEYEEKNFGNFTDTSASTTVQNIINGYFGYQKAEVKYNITTADIISQLEKGNLVMVPMDGRLLKNPYYTSPGPERHMLLVIGYDFGKKQFITNDPGTKRGKNYKYNENIFLDAIGDYPTGNHAPTEEREKAIIIISK